MTREPLPNRPLSDLWRAWLAESARRSVHAAEALDAREDGDRRLLGPGRPIEPSPPLPRPLAPHPYA